MKNPYPEDLPGHRYEDGGKPFGTKWQTHPVTGVTTVTILTDRAYVLVEPHPGWAVELGLHEPYNQTETSTPSEPGSRTESFAESEPDDQT